MDVPHDEQPDRTCGGCAQSVENNDGDGSGVVVAFGCVAFQGRVILMI